MNINSMETTTTRTSNGKRIFIPLSTADFKHEWMLIAAEEMHDNFNNTKYIINDQNRDVINQIYWYITGSNLFKGNLNKGILMLGHYGTGKTTIMKIMARIIHKKSPKSLHFTSCVNLADEVKTRGIEFFRTRPLILDELGREPEVVKDYGTEKKLIPEIISMRYNERSWTFATSNLDVEALGELYGGYIKDRLTEMFNVIVLNGKSFRK